MARSTARELLKEAAERLPDDASIDEAIEQVLFLAKIDRGRADVEAGRTVAHEEVRQRLGL